MHVNKNIFAIGIIFLFTISIVTPIVFGYNVKTSNEKEIKSTTSHDGGLMDSAWPMFQHDVRHTGRSPYGKSGNWRVEKWKANIGSMVFSSPAIDKNGTIYIGSNDWYFHAINSDGTKKWRFKTGGGVSSSPAIAEDGTIYVGSEDGKLYAIYPNGTKKWGLIIGDGWVFSSPVIDEDGIIYIASVNGNNICAVYPNGTKKWDFKTGGLVYCSPALDNHGILYCGSYDGYMYAIYINNGTLRWKYNTGTWCGGTGPALKDDIIYFGTVDGSFYAIYSNGTVKWKKTLGSNVAASPAIAKNGTIYVAAYKGMWGTYIYSINPVGSLNWKYEVGDEAISASPAIDNNGIIYFGTWDGILYAFNPNGTLRWKYKALDAIFSSPAIGEEGIIYFGSHSDSFDAYLYAIEPIDNCPPEKPSIDGPTDGKIWKQYTYTAVTNDPDGDKISYFFDWSDGTNSGWTEFVPSGTSVNRGHSWKWSDTYTIRVKAKDEYEMESDWETLTVTMPRNIATFNTCWLRFFDMFPLLQKILNY